MINTDLICIVCPRGCRLTVSENEGQYLVTGNKCKRGIDYGIKEVTAPTRVVTSTVKVEHPVHRRMPVVTKGAIPKGMMFDVMKEINKASLKMPIYVGDIVIENVLNTGINVVASRTLTEDM